MKLTYDEKEIEEFRRARIGTYYMIPLRTTKDELSKFDLAGCAELLLRSGWTPYPWQFDDLYPHINSIFSYAPERSGSETFHADSAIGINFQIPVERVMNKIAGDGIKIKPDQEYYVLTEDSRCDTEGNLLFRFRCMQLVIMHTGIGFLMIGIESRSPLVPDLLLNAGYNQNNCTLGLADVPDRSISFLNLIQSLLSGTEMTDYAGCLRQKRPECILRDTSTYSVAVLPKPVYGETSEEMKIKLKQLCLNLRHSRPFGSDNYEDVDEGSFFNCAALHNISGQKKFIRWGIYTLFERAAQVIFQTDGRQIDPINLNGDNREDNYLPFLLITLYERYSYLFFSEMLRYEEKITKKNGEWLEVQMLRLKAFGVILPGDMTPYHNENVFLEEQREIYDIDKSIRLIDDKINIIKHIQADKAERRRGLIEKILAVFGVISILCDSLGLLEILWNDTISPYVYRFTFGGELVLLAIVGLISLNLYKKR